MHNVPEDGKQFTNKQKQKLHSEAAVSVIMYSQMQQVDVWCCLQAGTCADIWFYRLNRSCAFSNICPEKVCMLPNIAHV